MKFLIFAFSFLVSIAAQAEDGRGFGLFGGAGLTMGSSSLLLGSGAASSKFGSQGYVLEGGGTVGGNGGLQLSAETGVNSGTNNLDSQTYLESSKLSYYTGKAAVFYGPVAIGGGYRHVDVTIKSLSTAPANYLESKYTGWTPMGFANIGFDIRKRYRGAIEGQYVTGTLKGGDGLSTVKFNELSISLRFFVLFD